MLSSACTAWKRAQRLPSSVSAVFVARRAPAQCRPAHRATPTAACHEHGELGELEIRHVNAAKVAQEMLFTILVFRGLDVFHRRIPKQLPFKSSVTKIKVIHRQFRPTTMASGHRGGR